MTDFSCEVHIKAARKPHRCEHCEQEILKGEPADKLVGTFDGDFGWSYMHTDCAEAGSAYASSRSCYGIDWLWLHELVESNEVEELRWLMNAYPAVASRMNVEAIVAKHDMMRSWA